MFWKMARWTGKVLDNTYKRDDVDLKHSGMCNAYFKEETAGDGRQVR